MDTTDHGIRVALRFASITPCTWRVLVLTIAMQTHGVLDVHAVCSDTPRLLDGDTPPGRPL